VLVTGAGPVGMLVTAVLKAKGIDDITVSEPAPARRERALAVGATRVISPEDLPPASRGARADDPYSVVFECSGRGEAAEAGLDQLDYAGTLVFVGTSMKYPRVNHNRVIILESTIIGAYNYDAEGFGPALDLLASGTMPLDQLIEPDDVLLDGLFDVMLRCAKGEMPGKVMIRPEVADPAPGANRTGRGVGGLSAKMAHNAPLALRNRRTRCADDGRSDRRHGAGAR
jgi:threonine dehydrogenase-like Zn-dependent dehydrogenase